MANDIGKAMSRLKHRDIRTRRRAVRTLFEHDDPSVLDAFKPLLDDDDAWFVSKALDAYRQWAVTAGPGAVSTLLNHSSLDVRRAGANLLLSLGEAGRELALSALDDRDGVVQKKASRALLNFKEADVAERLATHENDAVRIIATKHPSLPATMLEQALDDPNEGVRSAALDAVLRNNTAMDVEAFIPFLKANLQTVSIVIWIAAHAPERLDEFTAHLNQSHHKAMSDHLRAHANDSSDPLIQTLLESGTLEPIARWVLRQGPEEDDLRWALINDERLNIIERSKLLERLVGRAHEPDIIKRAEALRSATDEELLRVACENLSTAASELSP
jgi:hypothetical protein